MLKVNNQNKAIRKEFAKYAIPAVIGMVVSSLYNIVDGIFVGRGVGDNALGAINIVYPFIMFQIAITMLIAIGGATQFSVAKGRKDYISANSIFLQSIYLLIILSTVLNLLVLIFPTQTCQLLGADGSLLTYASDYIWWISLFGIIYLPGLGLSIFVRNDNAPNRELAGTLAGTVINIVLDYLFIMEFDMGIAGAAIATGIGQSVSVLIFLTHFLQNDRVLQFGKVVWNKSTLKKITMNGLPSFLMEFSQSAVTFSFNAILLSYVGTVGISYYSIVMYICSMFNMVLIGLTQGAQPIMSFNHGKGNMEIVKAVRTIASQTALILTTIIYGVIFFWGSSLASIFITNNPELVALASDMMKYYFLAFFPVGLVLINILYFQVTEQEKKSILLAFLRCIGFIQIFLFILPPILGVNGIYLSFLFGELCHYLLSQYFFTKRQKSILVTV